MEQNKFLKLFSVLAFLAFAAVSCWATAESLHLLLPSFPLVMCWIVTIGFFFIASWGTKMIVDSLNQQIYMEKRGLNLIGGIFIVLVFWLICSLTDLFVIGAIWCAIAFLLFFRCKKTSYYIITVAFAVGIWAAFRFILNVNF